MTMTIAGPDLLRLLAIPVFAYVAVHDVRSRRVPSWVWFPLVAAGLVALGWEGLRVFEVGGIVLTQWLVRVVLSVGLIAPIGYLFWWIGAFGKADMKAIIALAVVFPTFPAISIAGFDLPLVVSATGVFSVTILVNAVLVAAAYPFALAALNAGRRRFRLAMFVGIPVHWSALETRHGRLLEGTSSFTRHGVDLDALRMYLRWRGSTLAELREDPGGHRDPGSLPATPHDPGDGRVATDGGSVTSAGDPWGARAFVAQTDGIYGTRAEELRAALELLTTRDVVWITPGIPFLVPIALGLLVALTYGDVLTTLLAAVGV